MLCPGYNLRAMIFLDDFATVSEGEVDQFVKMKMEYLDVYNSRWAELKKEIARQEVEVQAPRAELGMDIALSPE